MIRHIVLLKFRDDVPQSERDGIYDQLAQLKGHLDIEAMSFGPNVSPEGLGRGFNGGFTMDFPNTAARNTYLADEDHRVAGGRLVSALDGGRDGLIVFDIEI
jgi:hypothetical protein